MREVRRRVVCGGLALVGLASSTWALGACGGGSPCDKAVDELAALRPETIRDAPLEMLAPWKGVLEQARTTCATEKRADAMDRVAEVAHAISMRSADLALAAAASASAKASQSAAPAPPPVWTVRCSDVVSEGPFFGLLQEGVPREVAPRLVPEPARPAGDAGADVDAGAAAAPAASPQASPGSGPDARASAVPDEALVLGGSPVYLAARGGKLEGSTFEGKAFHVKQKLDWPTEALEEGALADRIVAARGPEILGVAWVSNLNVYFAVLDVATEKWAAFGELPVSGDDGGRDLSVGDMAWGRASFGLTLRTASGFAIVEVLPSARAVRPAALVPAFVAGTPRIAWGGDRFVVAAGRRDGEPSMGLWLAPDGAQPASWLPLLGELPKGSTVEPLAGDLVAKDGAVHLAFRVGGAEGPPKAHLGHALAGVVGLESCP